MALGYAESAIKASRIIALIVFQPFFLQARQRSFQN